MACVTSRSRGATTAGGEGYKVSARRTSTDPRSQPADHLTASARTSRQVPSMPDPADWFTLELADEVIGAMADAARTPVGLTRLASKLDHLVHAMYRSGRLADLSEEQVEAIVYALRRCGRLRDPVAGLQGCSPTYSQDGLVSMHNA